VTSTLVRSKHINDITDGAIISLFFQKYGETVN
jgi:hypothetical protein